MEGCLGELGLQQKELSPLSDEQYGAHCGASALSPGHHPDLTECFISFDSDRGPALVLSSSPGEGGVGVELGVVRVGAAKATVALVTRARLLPRLELPERV